MGQIVPKLNLNKTPYSAENNSLVFAKNIRVDIDNTIHEDYAITPMSRIIGKNTHSYVDYNNILTRAINDIRNSEDLYINQEIEFLLDELEGCTGIDPNGRLNIDGVYDGGEFSIKGVIANNREFYLCIHGEYKNYKYCSDEKKKTYIYPVDVIIKYDEDKDVFSLCHCNWSYSKGKITGSVINNLRGEKILVIAESEGEKLVPLKCINLNKSTLYDDESIYTQTPNIPITNLDYRDSFGYSIPNGVYQFFVRYKIRDNFYTDWFLASRELYAGNSNITLTSFGTVKYVNTHKSSDTSFVFNVEHLFDSYQKNYKGFQIGFIVSNDDQITARAWKHFNFNEKIIYFDYEKEDGIEIPVIDLIGQTYQIYDVKNITSFKNKVYISNYKETDFNDSNLIKSSNDITVKIESKKSDTSTYGKYPVLFTSNQSDNLISGLKINNVDRSFNGENSLIKDLCTTKYDGNTVEEIITDSFNNINQTAKDTIFPTILDNILEVSCIRDNLGALQEQKRLELSSKTTDRFQTRNLSFVNAIESITLSGISIDEEITANSIIDAIYKINRYLNTNANFVNIQGVDNSSVTISIQRTYTYQYRRRTNNGGLDPNPTNPDLPPMVKDNITEPYNSSTRSTGVSNFPPNEDSWGEWLDASDNYTQDIEIRFYAYKKYLNINNVESLLNYSTLIPYQKYKFYIHYVKQNGEITNGYVCNNNKEIECPYKATADSIIYPVFNNIKVPSEYVAYFFSIVHTSVNSATVFNIKNRTSDGSAELENTEASCLDINLGNFKGINVIKVKQLQQVRAESGNDYDEEVKDDLEEGLTNYTASKYNESSSEKKPAPLIKVNRLFNGKYYYSSDSTIARYFGADGVLTFDKKTLDAGKLAYCVNDYSISDSDDLQLIKCTPYIKNNGGTMSYNTAYTSNLLGFICNVYPLDRERSINYYTDGTSGFKKSFANNAASAKGEALQLQELSTYISPGPCITELHLTTTNITSIYSNYNLNYLVLTEEPKETVKTYYKGREDESATNTQKYTVILRLFSSLTLFGVYDIPSMYKINTRKTYSKYKEKEQIIFDNTVRSSTLEGDESSIDIFKFHPNDYYNIPTNRGIITNLVGIGDNILCHTEDSIFRFTGSNNITSSDGEIVTNESTPFDTGVSEAFGSDFGFAGLQNKNDSIITETGYIFFDRNARIVYLYSGQGQINKITDGIEKLFKHRNIKHVSFANDYYNNRFFMCVIFNEYVRVEENGEYILKEVIYPVTLSFSINQDIKSFISLHDFYFYKAFNTRTKCYFLTHDYNDICSVNKNYSTRYDKLDIGPNQIYPNKLHYDHFDSLVEDKENAITQTTNFIQRYSIIDVIVNSTYETVKTLNSISWNSSNVYREFEIIKNDKPRMLNMADDILEPVPCKELRIYSDTCMSPLMNMKGESNDLSISSIESYKWPRYNQGYWSFNYFRNILNKTPNGDDSIDINANPNPRMYNYNSDNNSLIEGKYFVVRFIFDSPFKLESLILNYNNKL